MIERVSILNSVFTKNNLFQIFRFTMSVTADGEIQEIGNVATIYNVEGVKIKIFLPYIIAVEVDSVSGNSNEK